MLTDRRSISRLTVGALAVAVAAAWVGLATAQDADHVTDTTTVVCTFDSSMHPGLTTCSQKTDEISRTEICYPAGTWFTYPVRLWWHQGWYSSRTFRGNVVPRELNDVAVTGDFGSVPSVPRTDADLAAWDDAIYAHVVRPHAHLDSNDGVSEGRLDSYPVPVEDESCA